MPYQTVSDLPHSVQHVLPAHAQEIYLAAFNQAWENYAAPQKRHTANTREEIAHKVAWAAVKQKYVKKEDHWSPRS